MSDDWKVGDLALCISSGIETKEGRVYRVAGTDGDTLMLGLYFAELDYSADRRVSLADRFRKIRPDEHEDCEPEFATLLNRIKRNVEA